MAKRHGNMPPISSMSFSSDDGGIRKKKMRKGTHSCYECRRRKIRCIFEPDKPSVCTECFARGSRCVEQESAMSDVVVDQRKNLRERVARLELMLETLVQDSAEKQAADVLRSLGAAELPPTPASEKAPSEGLMIMPDSISSDADMRSGTPISGHEYLSGPSPRSYTGSYAPLMTSKVLDCDPRPGAIHPPTRANLAKSEKTREALMTILPPDRTLMAALDADPYPYAVFLRKCPSLQSRPNLREFVERVLSRGSPCELGMLVLLYGSTQDGEILDNCLALVDDLILSDDEYMSTLDGLGCAYYMGKLYSDIGQARKSWLTFRKATTFGQLLGLHRNHSMSDVRKTIWWQLYAADRFTSLMLGMPYSIMDVHCNLEANEDKNKVDGSFPLFCRLAYFAGRIIDRSQGLQEATYTSALELEAELNDYAASLPAGSWDSEPLFDCTDAEKALEWQEKLLAQMAFYQMKAYLHVPFMLNTPNETDYEPSRKACIDGSRELLRIYHILRADRTPLYQCKAVDFIAFTGCIHLVLGVLGYGHSNNTPLEDEKDWALVEHSMDIFRRASSEKGGRVALQSYNALQQLHALKSDANTPATEPSTTKIVIPFFGTISVQRGGVKPHPAKTPNQNQNHYVPLPAPSHTLPPPHSVHTTSLQDFPPDPPSATSTPAFPDTLPNPAAMDPHILSDGFYIPQPAFPGTHAPTHTLSAAQSSPAFATAEANPPFAAWPANWANMDLDQDWSWFLEGGLQDGTLQTGAV